MRWPWLALWSNPMKTLKFLFLFSITSLFTATVATAQEKPAEPPMDMQHMHHDGFMQEGMHHAIA